MSYKRVISLIPSATEMMFELGAESLLMGRSHECDFPMDATKIPVCTASSINNSMSSFDIDSEVKSKLQNALSLYSVNINLIKEIKPDLIITQDQCKVCAIDFNELEELLKRELDYVPKILSFHPNTTAEMMDNFLALAELLDKKDQANELIENWKERLEIIAHKVKFVKYRPKIVAIEWLDPMMTAGHWTPELINLAGGECILSTAGSKSTYKNLEEISSADPDGIIIAACGFDLDRVKSELYLLDQQDTWRNLRAVQKGHVFIADGNSYFNRPGPRLIDTAEIIAEILQVNQFYYGMEGIAWEQISNN